MGGTTGLLLLFVLGMTWACDAGESYRLSGEVAHNDNVCALCEEYVTAALEYLNDNKTQTEITEALRKGCTEIHPFNKECIHLVDDYLPLFFSEISTIESKDVCGKVALCDSVVGLVSKARQNSCETCHQTISELVEKLKDPEIELEMIRLLLKACKSVKNYEKQCKQIVFQYGPLILDNAEKFLESTDICSILHACPGPGKESEQKVDEPVLADS